MLSSICVQAWAKWRSSFHFGSSPAAQRPHFHFYFPPAHSWSSVLNNRGCDLSNFWWILPKLWEGGWSCVKAFEMLQRVQYFQCSGHVQASWDPYLPSQPHAVGSIKWVPMLLTATCACMCHVYVLQDLLYLLRLQMLLFTLHFFLMIPVITDLFTST